MDLLEKAALAEKAARASGDMLEKRGVIRISRKGENDFVTQMDLKSETLIRDMLLGACPEDQFFGEETGGAITADGRWVVDPIDGTTNYMRDHRVYTISIAYEHRGELVIGCVYCPGTDELFLAVRGHGATLNGRPIHVSNVADIRDAIVHLGFGHRNPVNLRRTMAMFPGLAAEVSDVRRSGKYAFMKCNWGADYADPVTFTDPFTSGNTYNFIFVTFKVAVTPKLYGCGYFFVGHNIILITFFIIYSCFLNPSSYTNTV